MLRTDRCAISKITQTDYEDVKKLYFDQGVRKYLGGVVNEERFICIFKEMLNVVEDSIYLVVRNNINGEFIGLVSLDKHHDGVNTEVSYQFISKLWGQGYAIEAIKKVISYAFEELNLSKIVAETQVANKASCRLLTKLGMSIETSVYRFGSEQYIFSISRGEYYKKIGE